MTINIKSYTEDMWEELSNFFRENWRDGNAKNHPMLYKKIFDWQLTGFGNEKGTKNSRILFDDKKIIGFNFIIPGVYQFWINDKLVILDGKAMSVLLVDSNYRGKGLGFMLLNEIYTTCPVCEDLGVNKITAEPIHLRNGFSHIDSLNRYIRPLISEDYVSLLRDECNVEEVEKWNNIYSFDNNYCEPIENVDFDLLEELWKRSTYEVNLFSLNRTAEFWKWRYCENEGFKYNLFGDIIKEGLIVARIEKADIKNKDGKEKKVLRIIEIVPASSKVWNGERSIEMEKLILKVLNWAKNQGCCAADFQISNKRLTNLLKNVGFVLQESNYGRGITSLAGLFQPLVYEPTPINAFWKVNYNDCNVEIDFNDTYIVKSDNDMDRPNIWPLP